MSLTATCDRVESLKGLDAYPKVGLSLTRMRGLPVALRMRMSMVGLWERRQENERAGGGESLESVAAAELVQLRPLVLEWRTYR